MIKALFFDIDGTLVSFDTHQIPLSTVDALRKAHEKGVKIIISTGRPLSFITNLGAIDGLIDGYITANGAYNFIGSHDVSCHCIAPEQVRRIIALSREKNVPCVIVGKRSATDINRNSLFEQVFLDLLNLYVLNVSTSTLEEVLAEGVLQVTPFFDAQQWSELEASFPDCIGNRWHPAFVDINKKNVHKGMGLKEFAEYFGISIEETMAFGDGGNDIPIIEAAGIGVAMGNANDEVKASADYVTAHIDHDGVAQALTHFNVI